MGPVGAAIAALLGGAVLALRSFRRQEDATNRLNRALINAGIYTPELSQQYHDVASALERGSIYGDDEILRGQAVLQMYVGEIRITERAVKAVLDLAAFKRIEVEAAATMLGKVVIGQNVLERHGIAVDEFADKATRLAEAVAGIERAFGGQAEAHSRGLGAVTQARNAVRNLLETVGQRLAPAVNLVAERTTDFARDLTAAVHALGELESLFSGPWARSALAALQTNVVVLSLKLIHGVLKRFGALGHFFKDTTLAHTAKKLETRLDGYASRARARISEDERLGIERWVERQRIEGWVRDNLISSREAAAIRRQHLARESADNMKSLFSARNAAELAKLLAVKRLQTDAEFQHTKAEIAAEKDATKRFELQLKQRERLEKQIDAEKIRGREIHWFYKHIADEKQVETIQDVLARLSDLRNSKFGAQVLIGKAAAVAAIGVSTTLAILYTIESTAWIPPPIGQIIGAILAVLLGIFGAEQIANIIDSDIDKPGHIGSVILDAIREEIELMKNPAKMAIKTLERGLAIATTAARLVGQGVFEAAKLTLAAIGAGIEFIGDIVGDVVGSIDDAAAWVGGALEDVGDAIADTAGDIVDFFFAEGGVVRHGVVTPLADPGPRFGQSVRVVVRGGLIPSAQEAHRIAARIHDATR